MKPPVHPPASAPVSRGVRPWRRRSLVVALGLAGALLAAVVAGELAGWRFLRQPLQRLMSQAAGVPVVLEGEFRLQLLGRPQLRAGHLQVAAAPGVPVPHLLDARDVRVAWRWLDLWRWQTGGVLSLRQVQAGALDARLVQAADGPASWQIGPRPGASASPAALPHIGSLIVGAGRIVFDNTPAATSLEITVRGGEGQAQAGRPPGYEATITGRYRALPLNLRVHSGAVLPLLQDDEPGEAAPALEVRVEGRAGASQLRFEGRGSALWSTRQFQGTLRLQGPSLASLGEPVGVTLPHTPPFDLAGWLSQDAGVWQLRADRLSVGRSLLAGDFRYDTRTQPPQLAGRLQGPVLALPDLGPAVGLPPGGAAAPAVGRVLPQRHFDLPSLRAMDADVQVQIDELSFASTAVAALRKLRTRVRLDGGVLQLQDLSAQGAGGEVAGSMRLDGRAGQARWAADLRLQRIDVAAWIRGLRTAPAPGRGDAVRAYLTGELSAEAQVTGAGRSTAEILGTLDGRARLRLGEGTLSHLATEVIGLDVAQALGVAIRGDAPLPLRCARIDLAVQHGVARPEFAVLDNRDSTLRLAGQVDLRNETLALRITAQPKDLSLLSLRTPVTVTGTMRKPEPGIEARRLAGRVLSSVVLGTVATPAAALLPLIDPGARDAAGDPCRGPGAASRPASSPGQGDAPAPSGR
jgi:AsmA family protein